MSRSVAVILVAAGRGERLGQATPKAFVNLRGKPILLHALEGLAGVPGLVQVVIAAPSDRTDEATRLASDALPVGVRLSVVEGGATRQRSVGNAVRLVGSGLSAAPDFVLIHDAARCFTPVEVFVRVVAALDRPGVTAVLPVLPVVDTIKRVSGDEVLGTEDRATLARAQTPQGFEAAALKAAFAAVPRDAAGNEQEFTDDAALLAALGHRVVTVEGSEAAAKLTTPQDLIDFEGTGASCGESGGESGGETRGETRSGIGVDVHRFGSAAPLVLGGLSWPEYPALEGHSDGDALCHAIVDALLSAAGLGDIGGQFGVDRPEYAGASGAVFISAALALLSEHGYRVLNVAAQLIGDRPKVAPRRGELEAHLSALLGAPVSIAATTTDGLGFLGNAEGVAAVATALIARADGRLGA